jgi:hypothetical protein
MPASMVHQRTQLYREIDEILIERDTALMNEQSSYKRHQLVQAADRRIALIEGHLEQL